MKIVLLNLLDSMMSGAAAFIFFQTILGKKKSQLPYYIILLIFVCSFTIYAAITSILIGNTSTLAVYLRLTLSSLLCFCLSFLYSANLRTKYLYPSVLLYYALSLKLFRITLLQAFTHIELKKILWIF